MLKHLSTVKRKRIDYGIRKNNGSNMKLKVSFIMAIEVKYIFRLTE